MQVSACRNDSAFKEYSISEVTVEQIEAAPKFFQVVTVQNLYNLVMRQSEDVLEYCQRANIGFIPWFRWLRGA